MAVAVAVAAADGGDAAGGNDDGVVVACVAVAVAAVAAGDAAGAEADAGPALSALAMYSKPSFRPSPFTADVLNIAHCLFFSADSPKASEIAAGDSCVVSRSENNNTYTHTHTHNREGLYRPWQILLVCKHSQHGALQFVFF